MKKKKFKFAVKLSIQDLSSIPLLNGVIFCKTRLLSGGDFSGVTKRGNVVSHCVTWGNSFAFPCKLSASPSTGILETCLCRISVRKEVKGGKSHEKLGYADINLAEYAGSGSVSRRYILQGYGDIRSHRQDNSILKITASMTLKSGDPLFKPQVSPNDQLLAGSFDTSRSVSDNSISAGTFTARSSESDERRRCHSDSVARPGSVSPIQQHVQSSSGSSTKLYSSHSKQPSVDKRYSELQSQLISHSRQSSNISTGDSACADLDTFHISPVHNRSIKPLGEVQRRIGDTRVNADDIIDQLLNGADLTADTSHTDEGIEMSLFLDNNGASTMSKVETRKQRGLKPIPDNIEDRFKTL